MPASLTCPPEPWTPSESETKSLSKIHAMEKKFSGGIQGRMGWVERMGLRRRQLSILLSSPSTVAVPAYLYIYIHAYIHVTLTGMLLQEVRVHTFFWDWDRNSAYQTALYKQKGKPAMHLYTATLTAQSTKRTHKKTHHHQEEEQGRHEVDSSPRGSSCP